MFWKTVGKVGVAFDKEKRIPMEIVKVVLDKLKKSFTYLLQKQEQTAVVIGDTDLN